MNLSTKNSRGYGLQKWQHNGNPWIVIWRLQWEWGEKMGLEGTAQNLGQIGGACSDGGPPALNRRYKINFFNFYYAGQIGN